MNKKELIDKVSNDLSMSKTDVSNVFESIFENIVVSLKDSEELLIPQFGKFVTINRSAQVRRNPKTGESVNVPAKTVVKFKPAKALKETFL